jgi:phosphatidylglycerophosphate synthase
MDDSRLFVPTPLRRPRRSSDPALRLGAAGIVGMAGLVALSVAVLGETGALALGVVTAAYAAGLAAAMHLMERAYPHTALGLCNLVTLARLVIVAALAVPLAAGHGGGEGVFALALAALLLDGVDGWLARRAGLASAFGARFDMEVDSVLALVLAIHAFAGGAAGWPVLLLGLPRYGFGLAGLVWPWLRLGAPERFSRKAVCVLQIATLIALQWPGLPGALATALVAAAAAALAWSFWVDVSWLRRQAAR